MPIGSRPRVIYRNNIPSPYFVERCNRIAERANLDFAAWFDEERQPDRSWDVREDSWRFPHRYLGPGRAALFVNPVREVRRARPDVYVSLYENPSFLAGIAAARLGGARVAIHVMKIFDTWRPPRRSKELAKRLLFPKVDAIHVPGPDAAAYARQYGARESQFAMFAEPVNVEHFRLGAARAPSVASERNRLGLSGCVFLHVGRLWSGKGLGYLFDAYETLRLAGVDASLLLVGDGVDEARYRARAAGLPNVVFSGFVQEPELPYWYSLADVLVFPTLGDPYGHVVQEAMAASLPVIASESAGDIRERLIDGVTGYIVPPADSASLHERMALLAADANLRNSMGQRGFERIQPRTVDWWAGEFERMVDGMLSTPRKRTRDVGGATE
jgi:glycosyltransferase involved in cell wall biosynthesis